jgi:acyl-CoA thioesterase-1
MIRTPVLFAVLLAAVPALAGPPPPKALPVVTILGDSITAGLGLPASEAAPAQLKAALKAIGVDAVVRGAGVSGDTTAGGLARVDFSVLPDTKVCVVELGANDYLQSVEPKAMQANLTGIVRRLKARHIRVVLTASATPRVGSGSYGRDFDAVFPTVAREEHVALADHLLEGVEDKIALKQADGLHPNAAGVKIIAGRLAAVVARVLRTGT